MVQHLGGSNWKLEAQEYIALDEKTALVGPKTIRVTEWGQQPDPNCRYQYSIQILQQYYDVCSSTPNFPDLVKPGVPPAQKYKFVI